VSSWAKNYQLKFHERILPENQRSLIGLQASAREWRREECFKLLSKHSDDEGNLPLQSMINLRSDSNLSLGNSVSKEGSAIDDNPPSAVYSTAHHADDQQETLLLKFLRGAYITNLQPVSVRYLKSYRFSAAVTISYNQTVKCRCYPVGSVVELFILFSVSAKLSWKTT
jgi:PP-loop family